ncbi:MAG: transglycosylase SLT domain-containing protein [Pseudobdellovibrionaceae bacterium]
MHIKTRPLRIFIYLLLSFSVMATFTAPLQTQNLKDQILQIGVIQHPFVFIQKNKKFTRGLEYELIRQFGYDQSIKLNFVIYKNRQDLIKAVQTNQVDVGLGRFRTDEETDGVVLGPAFDESYFSLFCFDNKNCKQLENKEGLYQQRLKKDMKVVGPSSAPFSIHWLLSKKNPGLTDNMQMWFQLAARKQTVLRIKDHYFSLLETLSPADIHKLKSDVKTKLPAFKKDFLLAGKKNNLPWQLIAAIGYQESHWDSSAISHTGVRGIMQLTEQTAEHLNLSDREDPVQSIEGGSRYLSWLFKQVEKKSLQDLPEKSQRRGLRKELWSLSLAAYNIGLGHLWDAQSLAQQRGLNPWIWKDVRQVLPLLEDPVIAKQLTFGMARGQETVDFVSRVKAFYDVLQ